MNVQTVLQWLKGNIFIVIFVVLMIAALVTMPILSGKMNKEVQAKVKERVDEQRKITTIEKTSFTGLDGSSRPVTINDALLKQYKAAVTRRAEDAAKIYDRALEHNHAGRDVIMPELFPEPDPSQAQILPQRFHERLVEAYDRLLEDVGAGDPPDPADVVESLQRMREQLLAGFLAVADENDLDEESRRELTRKLTDARTQMYVRRARDLGFYADAEALHVPAWNQTALPTLDEMYQWQWDYWTAEDILFALAAANDGANAVIDGAVKRLVDITISSDAGTVLGGSGGGSSAGGGGTGFGFGAASAMGRRNPAGGARGGRGGNNAAAPAGRPINPAAEAKLDYTVSLTGRQTNPLYDVRYVDVVLIVDPERIPVILDAFAQRNFITVIDLEVTRADPHGSLASGYFYGSGALAELRLQLETIWLREWMKPFMPPSVRATLGVPPDPPADTTG